MVENISVFGIYPHRASCEYALSALKVAGLQETDISVLLQDNPGVTNPSDEYLTKAQEGAATDVSGAGISGALGRLLRAKAIAITDPGPFLAAGPIGAALAGIKIDGVSGGMTAAMMGLGIPENDAKRYQGLIQNGGILLFVRCEGSNSVKKARTLLRSTGAEEISLLGGLRADHDDAPRSRPQDGPG